MMVPKDFTAISVVGVVNVVVIVVVFAYAHQTMNGKPQTVEMSTGTFSRSECIMCKVRICCYVTTLNKTLTMMGFVVLRETSTKQSVSNEVWDIYFGVVFPHKSSYTFSVFN